MGDNTKRFKFHRQLETVDCGPTCLKMVCEFYGKRFELQYLREITHANRVGVSLDSIQKGATALNLNTLALSLTLEQLVTHEIPMPSIVHWNDNHFVVLIEITQKSGEYLFKIADPSFGIIVLKQEAFVKSWKKNAEKGVLIAFEETEEFLNYSEGLINRETEKYDRKFLWKYVKQFSSNLSILFLILFLAGGLNLAIPILTQQLVDKGIKFNNVNFIYLVILSQVVIFLGIVALNVIKGWLLLHVNTRISVTLTSDFLYKLFRLPIIYFDTKWAGDLMNRISDNRRIERFLTTSVTEIAFAAINFIAFSVFLAFYDISILAVFFVGSALSIIWILFFLKRREIIDYSKFEVRSENTSNLIETISGMPEIKLNGAENIKRWEWEKIQAKLFKINQKELNLEQYQYVGSTSLTQLKNLIISFISAMLVVNNEITLGAMLSISYIVGQMNGPLYQLIDFFQSAQDASISMKRLGEVHRKEDEYDKFDTKNTAIGACSNWQPNDDITVNSVNFSYSGFNDDLLFQDLNLRIPKGKVTAIVGHSGSGKTTLMKLILGFYPLQNGDISIGKCNLNDIDPREYRGACGVVMQDGYIFSDTIANNISMTGSEPDMNTVEYAAKIANIHEFISTGLAKGYETKIGNTGVGLSKGQIQRILIARAVYKNPEIIMLDEATSALDSSNEKEIQEKLDRFFTNKTVLIIAHRLSTVKNADQIVVLDKGKIVESGNHRSLVDKRGIYFKLVKNQLELSV